MKRILKNIKENYILVLIVLITGILIGWLLFHSTGYKTSYDSLEVHEGHDHENDIASIWTCSMHPQIKSDKPGQCPICGMDLIPLNKQSSYEDQINSNALVMTESAVKLADIQTIIVQRGVPEKTLFLQGKVQPDERNIAELTARFGGRIENLFINFTGQNVQKGEKLATIYSPELVTAQRELLEAMTYKNSRPSLYTAAKGKLRLWDLNDEQISAIEKLGEPQLYFDITSPITGTITMRHVALGDYVKEGMALFRVVDLSHLWVLFDAYESDLPWIKKGDHGEFTIQSLPGKTYKGKVTFIDPFINANTRVAKVRIELDNPRMEIKPEMFVTGTIQSKIAESSNDLLIPKSSLLWTGKRSVVYVKIPDRVNPTFLYRQITLGPEAGNFYVVVNGLSEGEEIATNGAFKIDASAQLQGLPSMMNPHGRIGSTHHNHSEMNMDAGNTKMTHEVPDNLNTKEPTKAINTTTRDQLTDVYDAYLKMKDAFVASDAIKVATTSLEVIKALKEVNMKLLKGENHMIWMELYESLEKSISSINGQTDIEKQRIDFAIFNLTFYKIIKSFGINDKTAYYQYCPMANRDKGAYWFSDSEEIKNPYFGDMMLRCGKIVKK